MNVNADHHRNECDVTCATTWESTRRLLYGASEKGNGIAITQTAPLEHKLVLTCKLESLREFDLKCRKRRRNSHTGVIHDNCASQDM